MKVLVAQHCLNVPDTLGENYPAQCDCQWIILQIRIIHDLTASQAVGAFDACAVLGIHPPPFFTLDFHSARRHGKTIPRITNPPKDT